MVSTDTYGVPDGLFGHVPEDFYALVGRIVLVASLVENHLLELVWALDQRQSQNFHAGKQGSELMKIARRELRSWPSLAADGNDLLNRVFDDLGHRHALVHSMWPNPRHEQAFGWRPVLLKRSEGSNWIITVQTSVPELRALVMRLVALVDELSQFRRTIDIKRQHGER